MQNLITVQNRIPKLLEVINPFINSINLDITTDEEEKASGEVLLQLMQYKKHVKDDESKFIDPIKAQIKPLELEVQGIKDKYKPLYELIENKDDLVRSAIKRKQQEDQRKAQEALRLQREKERIEREEQEDQRFKAEEEVARLLGESKNASFEEQIEIDKAIQTNIALAESAQGVLDNQTQVIIALPPTKIQTGAGTVYRKKKYVITNFDTIDITKLPYEYLTIDKKKLQKAVEMGLRIEGVEVMEDFDMVTRKR